MCELWFISFARRSPSTSLCSPSKEPEIVIGAAVLICTPSKGVVRRARRFCTPSSPPVRRADPCRASVLGPVRRASSSVRRAPSSLALSSLACFRDRVGVYFLGLGSGFCIWIDLKCVNWDLCWDGFGNLKLVEWFGLIELSWTTIAMYMYVCFWNWLRAISCCCCSWCSCGSGCWWNVI